MSIYAYIDIIEVLYPSKSRPVRHNKYTDASNAPSLLDELLDDANFQTLLVTPL